MSISIQIGKIIRTERKLKGISQVELAEAAGVSVRTLGSIEKGEDSATILVIEKLLHELNITLFISATK